MPGFRAVVIEHGYKTTKYEREIITAAGGEFIDASERPLEDALKIAENAEGVMVRRLEVTRGLIQRFAKCKMLARYGVGTDNIDVAAATDAGMIVGHAPLYATDEVSVHATALLLACVRDVVGTHKRMEAGAWDVERPVRVRRMAGRTLGIVGFGNIGRAVARKLGPWDLRILATDPYVEPERAAKLGVQLVALDSLL
ncbi:MAG: NAD(P)-dependent oxidoreductase, partial [Planctomycetota bacterium]